MAKDVFFCRLWFSGSSLFSIFAVLLYPPNLLLLGLVFQLKYRKQIQSLDEETASYGGGAAAMSAFCTEGSPEI